MSGIEYTIEASVDDEKWTLYSHIDTHYNGIAKNFVCEGTLDECEAIMNKLVNCPECYMRDGAHKMDCSVGRTHMSERNLKDEIEEGLDKIPLIVVSGLKEHEDGGATLTIDTSPEGTRMLVEIGLTALVEKAIDAENQEYSYHTEPMSQELLDKLDIPPVK